MHCLHFFVELVRFTVRMCSTSTIYCTVQYIRHEVSPPHFHLILVLQYIIYSNFEICTVLCGTTALSGIRSQLNIPRRMSLISRPGPRDSHLADVGVAS